MINNSFEDLAQSLRILNEANMKFLAIVGVDRPEAVGNFESGFNSVLNAFHNLYDAMKKQDIRTINWYREPELCLILAIRNARHHNLANRIRTVFNYHVQNTKAPQEIQKHYWVDFQIPFEEEGGSYSQLPVSWYDINLLINLPQDKSKLSPNIKGILRNYVNADAFEDQAKQKGINEECIFINIIPLIIKAGK
ncbi:hypothetical protein QE451_000718 [Paenibacillus sp. SORGH_AS338]|uniref:hypothetical protein n=1 Tax=Paenibacillus sp. SORGH_AS_0338 TaxID=3041755 RepID=UPI002854C027|nr:hypothetical protein [Paenibacillus sp. SORGH_AS_0338]MDR6109057.1 hypothetical protein [Paenibacillus sp. SORGH_AS_0338]